MSPSELSRDEIAEILEDAIVQWKLSHEQLAHMLGYSKESVENWLKQKGNPRPHARRIIEELRERLQQGEKFPPKLDSARQVSDSDASPILPLGLPASAFATEAAAVVRRFFESIAMKDFKAAWKCLTSHFQDRCWRNGFDDFRNGYEGFLGLDNLIVAPLGPLTPPSCRVFVYYEDLTNVIDLPRLGNWGAAQLGQIDECCKSLNALRESIVRHGGQRRAIDQVPLSNMLTEQAGNVLQMASHLPRDKFLTAAGSNAMQQCLLSVPLIARVLKRSKGRFLIDQLLPVHWGKRVFGRD